MSYFFLFNKFSLLKYRAEELFTLMAFVMTVFSLFLVSKNNFNSFYLVGHIAIILSYNMFIDTPKIFILYNVANILLTIFWGGTDFFNPGKISIIAASASSAPIAYILLRVRSYIITNLQNYSHEFAGITSAFPDLFYRVTDEGIITQIHNTQKINKGPLQLIGGIGSYIFDEIVPEIRVELQSLLEKCVEGNNNIGNTFRFNETKGIIYFYEFRFFRISKNEFFIAIRDNTELELEKCKFLNEQNKVIQASKLTAIGEIAGAIIHEINGPLTVINYLNYAINKLKTSDNINDEIDDINAKAKDATEKIQEIINSMKEIIRSNTIDNSSEFTIHSLYLSLLPMLKIRQKYSEITIEEHIPKELSITAKKVEIGQIITNLINNAQDALKDHDGERKIIISAFEYNKNIQITVEDTGPGISSEIKSKIFEKFFTTKPEGLGTGLGLSIIKTITERHSGELYIDEASQNTKFILVLPKQFTPKHTTLTN